MTEVEIIKKALSIDPFMFYNILKHTKPQIEGILYENFPKLPIYKRIGETVRDTLLQPSTAKLPNFERIDYASV